MDELVMNKLSVNDNKIERVCIEGDEFFDKYQLFYVEYNGKEKVGLLYKNGTVFLHPIYQDITDNPIYSDTLYDDLRFFVVEKENLQAIMDIKKNLLLPFSYIDLFDDWFIDETIEESEETHFVFSGVNPDTENLFFFNHNFEIIFDEVEGEYNLIEVCFEDVNRPYLHISSKIDNKDYKLYANTTIELFTE